MFAQFYNEALRKLVIGFGSLFNDIRVVRKNADGTTKETIRVPLSYGPKEKFIRRIQEQSSISDPTKTLITLTRRNITSALEFTAKSYIYGPTKTSKVILTSEVDIHGSNFDGLVSDAHDLRIGITGGFTGEGYTAGNRIYGEFYYE